MMSVAGIGIAAAADPTGSVTGYVQTDSGTPLVGAKVVAWYYDHDPAEKPVYAGETMTTTGGAYTLAGLSSSSYRVRAYYEGYYSEYYATPNGVYYAPQAARVDVTAPGATSGINFSLGLGKSILGHVYQDNGTTAIQGAEVSVYENMTNGGDWKWIAGYSTVADGSYSITAYAGPGTYKVKAQAKGWAAEWYDNKTSMETADVVTVLADSDTTGIDFILPQTGYISGTVYQADGMTPLPNATIRARNSTNDSWVGVTHSASGTGFYYINLAAGTYRLVAEASGFMPQWCDNFTIVSEGYPYLVTWNSADPISVVGVVGTLGKNFSLLTLQAVETDAATGTGTTSATLNGNLASKGANDNVTVSFEYGTDTGGPYTPSAGTVVNATGAFSIPVSSLTKNTTYYFRAKAVGDVDPTPFYGDEMSFTTSTTLPTVTTNAASNLATTSATLNGTLTDKGTADNVTVSFEWGLTTSYGSPAAGTPPSMSAAGTFTANLSGLTAGTTYHFRAIADGGGDPVYGSDMSFTTSTTPPTVTTSAAGNLATTSATLNGNLTALGTASSVIVSFQWGTATGSYTHTTDNQTLSAIGDFSANLTGLTPGTTYYCKAQAVGNGTALGDEMTFTTLTTPPTVTTSAATSLATTSASLNGSLGSLGTATSVNVSFEWGTTTSYGSETTAQSVTALGAFTANLTGLTASTTYHFRAKAVGHGSAVYGEDMTFTTASLPDTTAPVITQVTVSEETTSGATITWTTSEAATSQIEYGLTEEYGSSTTLDTNLVTSHSADLTGLKAGKTYHYRVISKDAANNQAVSADDTFKTSSKSGGMPVWAWVLIALAVVGVIGAAAFFLIKGRAAQG